MVAPCKNCTVRHEICHAGCPDYLRFRAEVDRINQIRQQESDLKSYICINRARINDDLRRMPKMKGEK